MLPLPRARTLSLFCGLISALASGGLAHPISPQSSEYSLSGPLAGDQAFPAVTLGSQGGWLVWQDNRIDGNGSGIGARRIDASLHGTANPMRVNKTWLGDQERPQAALLNHGGAVVVWQGGEKSFPETYARFLNAAGGFASDEIRVSAASATVNRRYVTNVTALLNNRLIKRRFALKENVKLTRDQSGNPAVAVLPDGNVVVVYHGARATQTNAWRIEQRVTVRGSRIYTNDVLRPLRVAGSWAQDVFLRRLSPAGARLGGEVQINQFAGYNQRHPAIAVLENGSFVVTWVSEEKVHSLPTDQRIGGSPVWRDRVDIMARLFRPDGEPLSDEFTVNAATNLCANPSAVPLPGGGFVVAWSENSGARPESWDVWSRVFDSDGMTTANAIRVNTYTHGDQFAPRLLSVGPRQIAVWTSLGQDGSWEGVYGRYLIDGQPAGDEIRMNQTTASRQIQPTLATDGASRVVAAWSTLVRGSAFDVMARLFAVDTSLTLAAAGGATTGMVNIEVMRTVHSGAGAPALPPVPPTPLLVEDQVASSGALRVGIALNRHQRELRWNTVPGRRYQVQTSANLREWEDLGEPREAAGSADVMPLTSEQAAAFFRVIQVR